MQRERERDERERGERWREMRGERERERECHTAVLISSASVAALTSDGMSCSQRVLINEGDDDPALREELRPDTDRPEDHKVNSVSTVCERDTGHGDRYQTRKKTESKEFEKKERKKKRKKERKKEEERKKEKKKERKKEKHFLSYMGFIYTLL